jgi:hypothetical protein
MEVVTWPFNHPLQVQPTDLAWAKVKRLIRDHNTGTDFSQNRLWGIPRHINTEKRRTMHVLST